MDQFVVTRYSQVGACYLGKCERDPGGIQPLQARDPIPDHLIRVLSQAQAENPTDSRWGTIDWDGSFVCLERA